MLLRNDAMTSDTWSPRLVKRLQARLDLQDCEVFPSKRFDDYMCWSRAVLYSKSGCVAHQMPKPWAIRSIAVNGVVRGVSILPPPKLFGLLSILSTEFCSRRGLLHRAEFHFIVHASTRRQDYFRIISIIGIVHGACMYD